DALGGGQDVGHDAIVVHGEPLACAPPTAHHLVGDEQYAALFGDRGELRQVLRRGDPHAVRPDDRFDHARRDVVVVVDHVLEVVGAGDAAIGVALLQRAPIAVDLGPEDHPGDLSGRLDEPAT